MHIKMSTVFLNYMIMKNFLTQIYIILFISVIRKKSRIKNPRSHYPRPTHRTVFTLCRYPSVWRWQMTDTFTMRNRMTWGEQKRGEWATDIRANSFTLLRSSGFAGVSQWQNVRWKWRDWDRYFCRTLENANRFI